MILILGDVLPKEDVARICAKLDEIAFEDGRKTAGARARAVKANEQALGRDPRTQALTRFVMDALDRNPLFQAGAQPRRFGPLLFSRTQAGGQYGAHVDDALMGKAGARIRSDLAFTLFLTDPDLYSGGELVIEEKSGERAIKLTAGALVLYPADTIHRVEPVLSGVRIVCAGWVESVLRLAAQREILFDLQSVRANIAASEAASGQSALTLDRAIGALLRLWAEI